MRFAPHRRHYAANSAFGSAAARRPRRAPRAHRGNKLSASRHTTAATRPTQPSAPPLPAARAALRARSAEINSAPRATPPPLRGQLSLRLRRCPPPAPRSARAQRK
eukprot:scaffold15828_cov52-Phaeocystis_antarctica.AAC.2